MQLLALAVAMALAVPVPVAVAGLVVERLMARLVERSMAKLKLAVWLVVQAG